MLNEKFSRIIQNKNYIRICEITEEIAEHLLNNLDDFCDIIIKRTLPIYDGLGYVNWRENDQMTLKEWKFNRKFIPLPKKPVWSSAKPFGIEYAKYEQTDSNKKVKKHLYHYR